MYQISILYYKNNKSRDTEVMAADSAIIITGINYILKYIKMGNSSIKL